MIAASPPVVLDPKRYEVVIFDLDGVITRTATTHAAAWKTLFDAYLEQRLGPGYTPFSQQDYLRFVDGRPRDEGVRTFLASREIRLPDGDPEDPPDAQTVWGLGNRKNQLFHEVLQRDGAAVFDSSIALIRALRARGVATAVVSSSRNCRAVLQAAGIEHLFDTRVDGADIPRLGLKGKPEPDLFLEAAVRLGVRPDRAVVVEDAVSGVKAGRAGGFALVIGVDRGNNAQALKDGGADVVVDDLSQATAGDGPEALPSALDDFQQVIRRLDGRTPAVFLDYDGTLTPIVERPELAILADDMRAKVRRLAEQCTVAVVSGRDLADVRKLVQVDNLVYAGSHGFDIAGPDDLCLGRQQGNEYLPYLDRAEQMLREQLAGIPGCLVERKKMAIAIHYRQVADEQARAVEQTVDSVREYNPKLRKDYGKKIFELQPDMDWHKGKAVRWLLEALELKSGQVMPMYLGDDVTDENAFRELRDDGVGIKVMDEPGTTAAHFALADPEDVGVFFDRLSEYLEEKS